MAKTSANMSPEKAVSTIGYLKSIDKVREFIEGEERGEVIEAASQRILALDAAGSPEPNQSASIPKKKDPKNFRHWKYHTVRFAEDEDEPLYVDKVILGTQKNPVTGKDEDVTIVHRQQRGKAVPNVLTAVVLSWMDQVETRFKQKKKGGKNGGMTMVPRRIKVRDFMILESYDEKKPVAEVERMMAEQEDDAPDAGVAEE
jgi:hypothetical protein